MFRKNVTKMATVIMSAAMVMTTPMTAFAESVDTDVIVADISAEEGIDTDSDADTDNEITDADSNIDNITDADADSNSDEGTNADSDMDISTDDISDATDDSVSDVDTVTDTDTDVIDGTDNTDTDETVNADVDTEVAQDTDADTDADIDTDAEKETVEEKIEDNSNEDDGLSEEERQIKEERDAIYQMIRERNEPESHYDMYNDDQAKYFREHCPEKYRKYILETVTLAAGYTGPKYQIFYPSYDVVAEVMQDYDGPMPGRKPITKEHYILMQATNKITHPCPCCVPKIEQEGDGYVVIDPTGYFNVEEDYNKTVNFLKTIYNDEKGGRKHFDIAYENYMTDEEKAAVMAIVAPEAEPETPKVEKARALTGIKDITYIGGTITDESEVEITIDDIDFVPVFTALYEGDLFASVDGVKTDCEVVSNKITVNLDTTSISVGIRYNNVTKTVDVPITVEPKTAIPEDERTAEEIVDTEKAEKIKSETTIAEDTKTEQKNTSVKKKETVIEKSEDKAVVTTTSETTTTSVKEVKTVPSAATAVAGTEKDTAVDNTVVDIPVADTTVETSENAVIVADVSAKVPVVSEVKTVSVAQEDVFVQEPVEETASNTVTAFSTAQDKVAGSEAVVSDTGSAETDIINNMETENRSLFEKLIDFLRRVFSL